MTFKYQNFCVIFMLVAVLLVSAGSSLQAGTVLEAGGEKMTAGLNMPSIGWVIEDEMGHITGYRGVNLFLGYSEKRYFEPLQHRSFNPYWGWGTVSLISPYLKMGGEYSFRLRDDGSFWSAGGLVGISAGDFVGLFNIKSNFIPLVLVTLSYHF